MGHGHRPEQRTSRWGGERPPLYQEQLGASGPLVVFLPGVGGTTRYWLSGARPLASAHRLLFLDLLGFGQSPKPWFVRYSIDRHVAELRRALCGRVKDEQFTLVGHSFGAILALAYAARYPRSVSRLILLSLPHFGSEQSALRFFEGATGPERWLLTHVVLAAVACIVTRRLFGRVLPRLFPNLPRAVAEDLVKHTWRSATSTIWESVYRHDAAADAARVSTDLPVLLLHGDLDGTAPVQGVSQLVTARHDWALRILPGVDHHPFLRSPDICREAIRSFGKSS